MNDCPVRSCGTLLTFFEGRLLVSPFFPLSLALMYYIEGGTSFITVLFAALLHESGHIAAIYAVGSRVTSAALYPVGAVIYYAESRVSCKGAIFVSLSGIIANMAFAAVGTVVFCIYPTVTHLLFIAANLFFALFNLLPLRNNDGSNALHHLLEMLLPPSDAPKTEKILHMAGLISSLLVFAAAVMLYALSGASPAVAVLGIMAVSTIAWGR